MRDERAGGLTAAAGGGSIRHRAASKQKRRICGDNMLPVVVRLYRSVMLYI